MNNKEKVEFGDFQTPVKLAQLICDTLKRHKIQPNTIIEPTCGLGNILFNAIENFPSYQKAYGIEINKNYYDILNNSISDKKVNNVVIYLDNFFNFNWKKLFDEINDPILLIGNPPWVTNSALSIINSNNLPEKSNFKNHRGIDAITGKSNFDISEFIILKLIEIFKNRNVFLSFLCKTVVARNVLQYIWKNNNNIRLSEIYPLDSMKYFNASVDSCLFNIYIGNESNKVCYVYDSIENTYIKEIWGYTNHQLVNNVESYNRYSFMSGNSEYRWRNGIKHDLSKIMELTKVDNNYLNGYGDIVDIEDDLVFPLLKSSDLSKNDLFIRKYVIVTQKSVGQATDFIKTGYPRAWLYLTKHNELFNQRKSSIYKNKPKYSIFSVGDYTFSPWKIAISGLYKTLSFKVLDSFDSKPIILDDTCNFI